MWSCSGDDNGDVQHWDYANLDLDLPGMSDVGASGSSAVKHATLHPADEWSSACSVSVRLLREQLLHSGGEDGHDWDGVSLVSWISSGQRHTDFITWAKQGHTGRVTSVDLESRQIKAVVPVGKYKTALPLRDMNMQILWRNTGVRHVRANWKRNQGQATVPDKLLRLREMWQLAAKSGSDVNTGVSSSAAPSQLPKKDAEDFQLTCYICNKIYPVQLPYTPARRCCFCLLDAHESCLCTVTTVVEQLCVSSARSVSRPTGSCVSSETSTATVEPPPVLDGAELPDIFFGERLAACHCCHD